MNKTTANDMNVDEFLSALSEQQRIDSKQLIDMMHAISGEPARMWGSSIIGFGTHHYSYDSGREGDMPILSFSPRKANLTVYVHQGFGDLGDLLDQLGAHTTSVSCLYIKRVSEVHMKILSQILERTYAAITGSLSERNNTVDTVDEYITSFDERQQKYLTTIREIVKAAAPLATEKISYQIVAFQLNNRILLYYGGFKDHVSIYPVPKGLEKELAQYIRGRGTLWFPLDKPLPIVVIKKIAKAHIATLDRATKPAASQR